MTTSEWMCPVCGEAVEQSGKGRPREYCSKECRDLNNMMIFMEDRISKIPEQERTKRMRMFVRSNLQRTLNLTNGWNK